MSNALFTGIEVLNTIAKVGEIVGTGAAKLIEAARAVEPRLKDVELPAEDVAMDDARAAAIAALKKRAEDAGSDDGA